MRVQKDVPNDAFWWELTRGPTHQPGVGYVRRHAAGRGLSWARRAAAPM